MAVDVLSANVSFPSHRNGWVDPGELELEINGRPLLELVGLADFAGLTPRELPPSKHLLGRPDADLSINGRAAVLVCPLCGDLGCGAILARIEVAGDVVVWRDFIYGNNYDPEMDDPLPLRFEFERATYEAVLLQAAMR
jgi:hypothetical protein